MKYPDFRSYIEDERQRLIQYVRSLVKETTDMDAEDVVHDVLVKMLEKADLIVPVDNLGAYVYRSVRNRVIDYVRAKKPTLSLDSETDEDSGKLIDLLHDLNPNALEILQNQQGEQELFKALQELSDMEKKVIVAHEIEGIAFKDLSQLWEVPINTLISHKSRAMKKLKKYFLDL